MPINSPHPAYAANIGMWTRCRDVYEGQDAVKARGTEYLPRLDSSMSSREYQSYNNRAHFHEGFSRTIGGCLGAISRRDHVIDLPAAMQPMIANVTGDGVSINEFVRSMAASALIAGRAGVLVDYDSTLERCYLSLYEAASIISWTDDSVILLEDLVVPDPEDAFKLVSIQQYRELHIVDGAVTVTMWRKVKDSVLGDTWVVFCEATPHRRGMPLERLPFFWLSSIGSTARIVQPPMLGLVNTALNLWKLSADLAHGRHYAAIPTLVITGKTDQEPISVGATSAITLSDVNAKVYYATFKGDGLGSLERGATDLQAQMAALGASLFGSAVSAQETATAAKIRAGAQTSVLCGVVDAVEGTLQAALDFAAYHMMIDEKPSIRLNREFNDVSLDPQILSGMVAALQTGAIEPGTFSFMLDQAKMLPAPGALAATVVS